MWRPRRTGEQRRHQPHRRRRSRPAPRSGSASWRSIFCVHFFCADIWARRCSSGGAAASSMWPRSPASPAVSHRSAYNASKHGLMGLTKTLAAEWGGRGVRVNAVCPGWIKTEMDAADQGAGAYSDADIVDRVPLARFARPEDVAEAIAFLLDADRSGIHQRRQPAGGWRLDGRCAAGTACDCGTRP